MLIAITREVSRSIAQCELTHLSRVQIDLELARSQHQHYQQALAELGCKVVSLAEQPDLPDSVFVEDIAIVLDECAVITRPGAESRRPETNSVASKLGEYRKLGFIEAPGTLDGGDVLRVDRTLYVGLSGRSNNAAVDQLRALIAPLWIFGEGGGGQRLPASEIRRQPGGGKYVVGQPEVGEARFRRGRFRSCRMAGDRPGRGVCCEHPVDRQEHHLSDFIPAHPPTTGATRHPGRGSGCL